jgi:tripartite-type tricarboxylate transporter receptor subunit TctC
MLHAIAYAMAIGMSASAGAADYPIRPIRFVVPQPPGGAADISARLLGQKLGEQLKQQVVVDNRSGAGGTVGTDVVAKAPPDGYTILLGYTGPLTINPSIYKQLPYRPAEDFDPITLAMASPFLLVVHPSTKVNTVAELISYAKAKPGQPYASTGNGSLHHLSMEWFKSLTGTNFTHVPYKGSQSFTAVVAGEVPVMFGSVLGILPHVNSNRVKAIAITSKNRSRLFPTLPTVAESGLSGFEAANWFGLLAPRGTPRPIVMRINGIVNAYVASAEMRERLATDGADPMGGTPEEFGALIRNEIKRWAEVVRISGAKVD